jgi:mono/diheme cytochrome c family protein
MQNGTYEQGRNIMKRLLCFTASLLLGGIMFAHAADTPTVTFEMLKGGKQLFEDNCIECHDLTWPLQKVADREGWDKILTMMANTGANLGKEERQMVLEYLVAKSTFQANCRACHDEQTAKDKGVAYDEYQKMVKRCADQKPGMLTEQEVKNVSGYLTLGK